MSSSNVATNTREIYDAFEEAHRRRKPAIFRVSTTFPTTITPQMTNQAFFNPNTKTAKVCDGSKYHDITVGETLSSEFTLNTGGAGEGRLIFQNLGISNPSSTNLIVYVTISRAENGNGGTVQTSLRGAHGTSPAIDLVSSHLSTASSFPFTELRFGWVDSTFGYRMYGLTRSGKNGEKWRITLRSATPGTLLPVTLGTGSEVVTPSDPGGWGAVKEFPEIFPTTPTSDAKKVLLAGAQGLPTPGPVLPDLGVATNAGKYLVTTATGGLEWKAGSSRVTSVLNDPPTACTFTSNDPGDWNKSNDMKIVPGFKLIWQGFVEGQGAGVVPCLLARKNGNVLGANAMKLKERLEYTLSSNWGNRSERRPTDVMDSASRWWLAYDKVDGGRKHFLRIEADAKNRTFADGVVVRWQTRGHIHGDALVFGEEGTVTLPSSTNSDVLAINLCSHPSHPAVKNWLGRYWYE